MPQRTNIIQDTVVYRMEHPEVMLTALRWREGDLAKIGAGADVEMTRYYSYGELCVSFCTVCLYHLNSKSISQSDFDGYYKGLMNLMAHENTLFFDEIVKEKYCAKEFRRWFEQWKKSNA